jgi:hypothetical protein
VAGWSSSNKFSMLGALRALPDGGATLLFNCEIKYGNPKSDASIPIPPPPDAGQG